MHHIQRHCFLWLLQNKSLLKCCFGKQQGSLSLTWADTGRGSSSSKFKKQGWYNENQYSIVKWIYSSKPQLKEQNIPLKATEAASELLLCCFSLMWDSSCFLPGWLTTKCESPEINCGFDLWICCYSNFILLMFLMQILLISALFSSKQPAINPFTDAFINIFICKTDQMSKS